MNTLSQPTSVASILDGLEYLVAEALRSRRPDLAEHLVLALHAVADLEEGTTGRARSSAPMAAAAAIAAAPALPGGANVVRIHGDRNPAHALHLCLEQLQQEASAFNLPLVAHLIGIAGEAAQDAAGVGEAPES